ncbi:RsmB/NOP family class I SAM-dependent RNA methyltransferase [Natronobacterium gregoryi]|uniref:NOL1/NOP2/sun family putative RNA methylase n=2 Tax=Natronobacterium gregoryi TaxID=44930 RepID=L0ANT0_NATGS|nr:RsmB/NOP family class I SAM-dependent RNA methyltransferase [Natronobacterium gregoryi]AFZ74730.1 NOL1/NOP2/sun family putative RNA methylase [Natronobacterium gregoryi SP2]ELY73463.1 RNA methylase, NOL1/NOP2/sun family protein [Natronobacterium gregoryi SP2]PLK20973.1 SAM-dependent methyltransferase [Natronobacterium gregoryi SP2]SFJ03889.1 NOL1/NOP2/sun family putative RNA methylase [Natronobacterium gregoryi]
MEPLERYRPIVDDFEAFLAACRRPLGNAVRVNTIKASVERATAALEADGVAYDQADWNPQVLRLETDSPGSTWASFHGFTHGQEEVSAVPPVVLDPEPGERVWDACAAPGGKATQLSALMDDEGTVVANDSNLGRISALRFNAERLGATNLAVTNADARNYSLNAFEFDAFDRALVDAPCSCEGTIRKNPDALEDWSEDHIASVSGIQKGILRRAVQATREGGTVVYSTCTFAPEENEAVVQHVLESEDCRVVEFDLGLEHAPGLTKWDGEEFDETLERAARIYPHHNDTGGFFVAKLEVTA